MCGIAGIVSFDGAAPRPAVLARDRLREMQRRLRHRGPDGGGEVFVGAAALAHNRLAMADRAGGAQPMTSADGRWTLVYNGEIYDHLELRRALDWPWPFRTRSDAETVLAAFARWGPACAERLEGMFAFFVWDEQRQRGFAVRDRLGVKPFAFSVDGGELRFASEAKALVGHAPAVDAQAVVEYLVAPAFSGVERSPFAGVRYLPPGHWLSFDRDGLQVRRWWRWHVAEDDGRPEALVPALRAALERAVARTTQAEAPLGVFLSGGVDSTAIAALAGRPAFTVTFEGQAAYDYDRSTIVRSDDTPFARQACAALGLAQTEVPVARAGIAADLRRISLIDDALPAWEQEIAQHHLALAAARSVKGVLVGDAADETHYGYGFLLDDGATSSPAAILRRLGSVPLRAEWGPAPVEAASARYQARVMEAGDDWSTPAARRAATTRLVVERWLPRLLHNGDIHTMHAGIEARVPFADTQLLALAQRVPAALALRDGVEKWALREALRGLIPEPLRTRRKSALPKDQGVQAIYQRELRTVLLDPPPLVRRLVDLAACAPLAAASRLTEASRAQIFRIVCLACFAHHYGVKEP
jgi:asparagine synthase (glutamine-hydrolysing)